MNTDPIADMLTRIRNAITVKHETVGVPGSRMKTAILRILKEEGFIEDFDVKKENAKTELSVKLKYVDGQSVIRALRRISKPGCRSYRGAQEINLVKGGLGIAVVSTSRGVISDSECRKRSLGGEIICEVW